MKHKLLIIVSCISALICITALTLNATWMFPHDRKDARISGLSNPITPDEASIQRGKALDEKYCMSCHKAAGKLEKVQKKVKEASDSLMFSKIYYGNNGVNDDGVFEKKKFMPGFGTDLPADSKQASKERLTNEQIWDIVNYYRHAFGPQKEEYINKQKSSHEGL